jgi:hypothetical protein
MALKIFPRMHRTLLAGLLLLILQPVRAVPAQAPPVYWQTLAPGISYREFYLPDPNHLYVARLEIAQPAATIESSIAQGRLSGGLETVRQMAARYDGAIGYWGEEWGSRSKVVVAINGSYYDTDTGAPWSGQIHSGWYAKRFEDRQTSASFAWTLDRQPFIGGCVAHRPARQIISFLPGGQTLAFDGINIPRQQNQLILYTSQYDATTQQPAESAAEDQAVFEALVEVQQPVMITPLPAMVKGTIKATRQGQGSFPLLFDQVVLSASGNAAVELNSLAREGQLIGISQEMKSFTPDCKKAWSSSWERAYAGVSGSFNFLRDGKLQGDDDLGALLWNPRTAVAFNDRYVFFIVVDGRDRFASRGMSMTELGVFARNELGAAWGVALDGGGSSTMVVNGKVVNNPNTDVEDPNVQAATIERAVANGLMMVIVEPKEISPLYKAGTPVSAVGSAAVEIRLGPGKNYLIGGQVAPATPGVILEDAAGLNGVLASGSYWWKVTFAGVVGWVSQENLAAIP